MFIQTEDTPNPRSMKFIPGETVMEAGTIAFTDSEMAKKSPLAEALFTIEHVDSVFFGQDFVSVTHDGNGEWTTLKPYILTTIMEHYVANRPILREEQEESVVQGSTRSEEDSELVVQIKELIDTRVRPAVAQDGGDIIYRDFDDGVVFLELRGACSGCPSSTATLKDGIENMLKHYVPEIARVEAIPAY